MKRFESWAAKLLLVLFSVAVSTGLTLALRPYSTGEASLMPFTLGVVISAFYGGFVAAMGSTILGFLIADYYFIEPLSQFLPVSIANVSLFVLFLTVGGAISLLRAALAKANSELRATLTRLELVAQQARIGFHEYIGSEDRQIWTPEMERLFGLETGKFEGGYADWIKRIHPEDRDRVTAERSRSIEQHQAAWKCEYRAVRPDGQVRWMEGRSQLSFSGTGALDRIIGATIDITERHELERALTERTAQLVDSNRELERFAYTVSHDLRTPLRGITAMTEMYLSRTRGSLDRESLMLFDQVLSSATRMRLLIQDILELATVSIGAPAPEASVDSTAVVQQAIQDLSEEVRQTGAIITFDRLPDVRGDANQISQLFRNLLGNAIKYHGQQAPEVHISATPRGRDVVFRVKDNGIGIDPRYHRQIFEPLERLHSASDYEGTGLGLAICKRIVQRHHGRIWVESEPGKGSSFYVELPGDATTLESPRHTP